MSTVSNVNNAASSGSSGSSSSSSSSSTSDAVSAYNTFLTLLTTELQNQDPLNPTDTSEFTSQLIGLAGVEQQVNMSSTLSSILGMLNSYGLSNGVAYIDKSITYDSDTAALQDGSAQWQYTLPSDADSVKLTVKDSDGNVVWSGTGDTGSGTHAFSWDGTDSDGAAHTSGAYTLTVTATDSSGAAISSTISAIGTVTGVDTSSGTTELQLGDDFSIPLADVIGIHGATN
jgi:flagellar basal-body rod modification protein FlgD